MESETTNKREKFTNSVRSFYDTFKDNVVANSNHYSYYTSIIALVILILVLYCNYSLFSPSGFFWITVELALVMFMVWHNTMIYLQL